MASFPEQSAIYWFDPAPVKGAEARKIRPCIVVSPNVMNSRLETVIVVPLTSTVKPWPFRPAVTVSGRLSSAMCDQIRTVDKGRLKGYLADLQQADKDKLYGCLQAILSE